MTILLRKSYLFLSIYENIFAQNLSNSTKIEKCTCTACTFQSIILENYFKKFSLVLIKFVLCTPEYNRAVTIIYLGIFSNIFVK